MLHCDDEDFELLKKWEALQRPPREREWVSELLRDARDRQDYYPQESKDLVERYLLGRLRDARLELGALEHEVYVRLRMHKQNVQELDQQVSYAAFTLNQLRGWAVGYNRGIDIRRVELERTLRELRREKRTTRVRAWDDLVRMRGELRARRRDYFAALRRCSLRDR